MDRTLIKCKIPYREKLNKEAKLWYLENNQGNQRIWSTRTHRVFSDDLNELPHITFPDIFSYLVCGVSAYTFEQFKN